jgi:hypothetical protein
MQWTVVSVRNGMTGLPFTHGVGLGVKNKNQMPDSAKALIAAFSVAGRVDVFEYPPPQGAESVILVGQRSLN